MSEIKVQYPWSMINERKIGTRIYSQFLGPKRRVLIPLSIIVPFLIGAALLHNLTSLNMWRDEVIAAVLLFYLSIACWMFTTTWLGRLVDAQVAQAPHRQTDIKWVLSSDGLQGEGPIRPWSDVIDVKQFNQQTVLVLSLRLFIILPHEVLPDGLTPEQLLAQIEAWRA